ncbi:MAG: helix-turn-helix transcriptional regulator [Clostridia bacterium]|nr:helix-turn-helix transcriptional regulator [Clostridia bacterium]
MPNVTVGKRIRELREKIGMTQEELAKHLNCSRATVAMLEIGERGLSDNHLPFLADLFNVSCDYIIRGVEAANIDTCKKTGLSNKAVEKLSDIQANGIFTDMPKVLFEYFSFTRDNNPAGEMLTEIIESPCFASMVKTYMKFKLQRARLSDVSTDKDDNGHRLYNTLETTIEAEKEKTELAQYQLTKAIEKCFTEN